MSRTSTKRPCIFIMALLLLLGILVSNIPHVLLELLLGKDVESHDESDGNHERHARVLVAKVSGDRQDNDTNDVVAEAQRREGGSASRDRHTG